jgi:hypothetical protein
MPSSIREIISRSTCLVSRQTGKVAFSGPFICQPPFRDGFHSPQCVYQGTESIFTGDSFAAQDVEFVGLFVGLEPDDVVGAVEAYEH